MYSELKNSLKENYIHASTAILLYIYKGAPPYGSPPEIQGINDNVDTAC